MLRITFQRGDAPLQRLRLATLSASLATRSQCDYCDVNSEAKTAGAAASRCRLASADRCWRSSASDADRSWQLSPQPGRQILSLTEKQTPAERAFRGFHFEMTEGYLGVQKERASILNPMTTSASSCSGSQTHDAKASNLNRSFLFNRQVLLWWTQLQLLVGSPVTSCPSLPTTSNPLFVRINPARLPNP